MRVTEDGHARTVSRVQAVLTTLVAKALSGDVRAAESVLRVAQQNFPEGEEPEIMKVQIQRFSDGEILADRTLQVGGGGQSTDWHYRPQKKFE
jgi:hypothetical protein